MPLAIRGLGTSVPEHPMTQQQAVEMGVATCTETERQGRTLQALFRRSGVQERRTVLPHRIANTWVEESPTGPSCGFRGPTTSERTEFYEQHASPLALDAASKALDESGMGAQEITHLVTVSCTGFSTPGVDFQLIDQLGLPATVERVNVGFMGCHAFVNGMRVANGFTTGLGGRVLVCAVELCSLHYCFGWNPERLISNALFADGSAAVVCDNRAEGIWRLMATGSCLIPRSLDAMTWRVGNHGFEMTLSAQVPDLIVEHLRPWLSKWLAEHDHDLDQIDHWAVHPGGPRIVTAVEESLGLSESQTQLSREILANHGNMSSPTIMFILDRLRRSGASGSCLAIGFGPGLVAEVMLLERIEA